jgi:hypothetical protein
LGKDDEVGLSITGSQPGRVVGPGGFAAEPPNVSGRVWSRVWL